MSTSPLPPSRTGATPLRLQMLPRRPVSGAPGNGTHRRAPGRPGTGLAVLVAGRPPAADLASRPPQADLAIDERLPRPAPPTPSGRIGPGDPARRVPVTTLSDQSTELGPAPDRVGRQAVVEPDELRRAEQLLMAAYALARATGYRSGSPEMRALHFTDQAYRDARRRRQQQVDRRPLLPACGRTSAQTTGSGLPAEARGSGPERGGRRGSAAHPAPGDDRSRGAAAVPPGAGGPDEPAHPWGAAEPADRRRARAGSAAAPG